MFCYTRGKSQGEARLHRLRSLGVGGHVAEADADGRATLDAYEMALSRELDEEVEIQSDGAIRRVGLINDDSNPVGQVHLGVVHLYELERPAVAPREDGLAEAEFVAARPRPRPPGPVRDLVADLHRRALLASRSEDRTLHAYAPDSDSTCWTGVEAGCCASWSSGATAWGTGATPGWRWSSQSINGGKISRDAYRLQTRSQWP